MYHNLESFRQTRKHVDDLGDVMNDCSYLGVRGTTYDDNTLMIYRSDDCKWNVLIGNVEQSFDNLGDAEYYLFTEFYLSECWSWPDMMELTVDGDVQIIWLVGPVDPINSDTAVYRTAHRQSVRVQRDSIGNLRQIVD